MKIPTHKGKFVLVIVYAVIVFISPFYFAYTYSPVKIAASVDKLASLRDGEFFKNYLSLLKNQKVDEAYSLLSPEAQQSVTPADFTKIVKQFSTVSLSDTKTVGAQINTLIGESTSYHMTYELANDDSENKYVLVNIAARNLGQGIKIDTLRGSFEGQSIIETAKFSFPAADWKLLVALAAPLFVVYTAYRYLIKASKPRWWWLIGILFLSIYIEVNPGPVYSASFGFNGFMGLANIWGPWVFIPFLPLGAVVYYFLRKRLEV